MKTILGFLAVFAVLALACHVADAANPLQPAKTSGCVPTGEFNLSPNQDALLMKVICPDSRVLRAPRLGGNTPNIFRIPFERAVISIMLTDKSQTVLHLHYELEGDDVHHIVTLAPQKGVYEYSFANLVPNPVKPIPLVKK